jgi:hypothetical protein
MTAGIPCILFRDDSDKRTLLAARRFCHYFAGRNRFREEMKMSLAAKMRRAARLVAIIPILIAVAGASAETSASPPAGSAAATADNAILLTIFLKHDQSRPLGELDAQLANQGFYKAFPPPGIEVVSWYIEMGMGQVITLRLPASRLREVNRVLEDTAWGAYRTEFYPTYDYKAIGMAEHEKAQ